jgi:hypothetical protein
MGEKQRPGRQKTRDLSNDSLWLFALSIKRDFKVETEALRSTGERISPDEQPPNTMQSKRHPGKVYPILPRAQNH